MGSEPTMVGEFGTPFDMNEKASYKNNDFDDQTTALDRCFCAMESNRMNYTLWNYTADNHNARGDNWNGEDLSIFSTSQKKINPIAIQGAGHWWLLYDLIRTKWLVSFWNISLT